MKHVSSKQNKVTEWIGVKREVLVGLEKYCPDLLKIFSVNNRHMYMHIS